MRILLIPLGYNTDNHDYLVNAFNKKGDSLLFNSSIEDAISFKPDVIFYQGSLTIDQCWKIKALTKAKWITWTGDVRYTPLQYQIELKGVTDVFMFPFDGSLLNAYERILGKPCKFIFEPFQDWKFKEPKEYDYGKIIFIGNAYEHLPGGQFRTELESFLMPKFSELEIYGSIPGTLGAISPDLVAEYYNDAYISIAENNWSDIDNYFTPRNLIPMAAGSCCVMKTFPGIEDHFTNFEHCIYYRHKYELIDVINFLKANPEVRNSIAKKGHEHVKTNYSVDVFVDNFINNLK